VDTLIAGLIKVVNEYGSPKRDLLLKVLESLRLFNSKPSTQIEQELAKITQDMYVINLPDILKRRDAKRFTEMLEEGMNPDLVLRRKPLIFRVLSYIDAESLDMLESLIAAGAEVDSRDLKGRTAFHDRVDFHRDLRTHTKHTTMQPDNVDIYYIIFDLLLNEGANIDSRDNRDCTPLHTAFNNRDEEMVKLLLERGAEVDAITQKQVDGLLSRPMPKSPFAKLRYELAEIIAAHVAALKDSVRNAGHEQIMKQRAPGQPGAATKKTTGKQPGTAKR